MSFNDPRPWRDEPVHLVPPDPRWVSLFEEEATLIRGLIGPWIIGGVHHVGSTAVPGLDAKPILDIAVGVETLTASRPCIGLLSGLQYLYAPYRPDEMHWFCKPGPGRRTHHLHLIPTESPLLADEIAFRDYLRAHPARAAEYAALKRRLCIEYARDREAYTEGKSAFVKTTTDLARAWKT